MKEFVITIPIDENADACMYEIGYRLYVRSSAIFKALEANNPDELFPIFDGMDNPDLGIKYGFSLEITCGKTKEVAT